VADVKSVAIKLVAMNDDFKRGMKEGADATSSFGKVSTVALAGAAAAALAFATKSTAAYLDYGKSIMKLSRISGENIEASSKMAFAAQQSGVDTTKLANGVKFMEKNMAAASPEFAKLGVNVRDSGGKLRGTHDVLLDTADAISLLSNGAAKTAAILGIFGRAGLDLGVMLNKGRAGILALEAEAQKYGLVLTKDNVDAIQQNIDAHRHLDAAMQGLQVRIGQEVLPMLTTMTEVLGGLIGPVTDNIGVIAAVGGALLGIVVIGPKVLVALESMAAGGTLLSTALTGAAAVGIMLIMKGLNDLKARSLETQKALSGSIDYTNYAKGAEGINKEVDAVNAMGAAWESKSAAEKLANAGDYKVWNDAAAQLEQDQAHFAELTNRVKGLGTALRITGPEAQALSDKMHFDLTGIDPAVYTPIFQGLHDHTISAADAQIQLAAAARAASTSSEDVTKSLDAQRRATKELNDEERALLDPQFAMFDSLGKLKEAQDKSTAAQYAIALAQGAYNDALAAHGPASAEAVAALQALDAAKAGSAKTDMDLARANIDLDAAVRNLSTAFVTGDATVAQTKATLDGWVTSGRMTQAQADAVTMSLGFTKLAADNLNGTSATVKVGIVDDFSGMVVALAGEIASEVSGMAAALAGEEPQPHAMGGDLSEGWNIVGEQGPELAHKAGSLVSVATAPSTRGLLAPHPAGGVSAPAAASAPGGYTHNGDIVIGTATTRTAADIVYEQRKQAIKSMAPA
jgi:hypothetical protein